MSKPIKLDQENFGTLAICAIRYCQGRQTYMPSLVQSILKPHLKELSDKDLSVMLDDCDFQERMNLYGSNTIDKPDWLKWKELLLAEKEARAKEHIKQDMEKETLLYQMLKKHAGHRIEITEYGDGTNFSLEDMDTNEVIFDTDIYDLTGREND